MAHKNYGSIGHTNTNYNNHSNSGYNNHTNTGYNNHSNNGAYSNHTNSGYNNHANTGGYYNNPNDYLNTNYYDHYNKAATNYTAHGNYSDYHQGYAHGNYGNHTNTGASGHTNTGANNHSNTGYNNHSNNGGYNNHSNNGGYNNHSNTGYTNHVNTTTNAAPTNVSNVSRGDSAYYKDTITLTWTAATDNNKCISVVSRNTGSGGHADNGIWENTTLRQAAVRSWAAAYWNPDGSFGGSTSADVYGNAATAATFENWLRSVDSVANRTIAVLGFDEPYTNAAGIISLLKSWGYSSLNNADGSHFVFCGITTSHVAVRSQQTVRRYGTSDVRVASAAYTIPGVSSSQQISYYIDYAFKPVGGSYGAWTRIVNGHTSTSYAYSLASHGNGHIKFRVLSTDGVDNSASWIESSEVRVLKYSSNLPTTSSGNNITHAEVNNLIVDINNLAGAVGVAGSAGISQNATILKTALTNPSGNGMRDTINRIAPQISKATLGDTNLDKIYSADIQNIKNWLKGV